MEHPDYDSDYKHSYINGSLEHPLGAGYRQPVGRTWAMANLTEEDEETSLLNADRDVFAERVTELTLELCGLVRRLPKVHRRVSDTVALVAGWVAPC